MKNEKIIRVLHEIDLKNADFIAAWPGMGNVALGAVDYFRRMMSAKPFAEIDLSYLFSPDMIAVNNGLIELPELPKNYFYYTENPPIIFFESDIQLGGIGAMSLLNAILDFVSNYGVKRVFTGAAYSLPITHQANSELYGVVNTDSLKNYIEGLGVRPMAEGQISGLNGLLLGYALKRKMDTICLLATMPLYAVNLPNPKASKAIVEKLSQIFSVNVDMVEIDAAIVEMSSKMDVIAESIKDIFPGFMQGETQIENKVEEGRIINEEDKIPSHVLGRIEKLFHEAQKDKKKAYLLKAELDRWNLYKLYEDRFLNLFREKQ